MRDDLDHLPASKQRELEHVVRVLFEEFDETLSRARQPWKKAGRILKIILYGSYARGDWVDDPIGGYRSDYDVLIVVNDDRLTDMVEYWSVAEDRLIRDHKIMKKLSTEVGIIVHTLADVNRQLERGRPFFVDIARQGVILYEAGGGAFAAPHKLPHHEALLEAQRYFKQWYPASIEFLTISRYAESEGWSSRAAFLLHQAAEQAYHCVLLVSKLYSPKSHNLNFLRSHCEDVAPSLAEAWPRDTKFARRCFDLLKQAYINARYSEQYSIQKSELAWCTERVALLQSLALNICKDYI